MIIDWLESRFGEVRPTSNGEEYRICCPFCSAKVGKLDTKYHMYVSAVRPVAHCFRCEWKGHYMSLVRSVDGCSYSQALEAIDGVVANAQRLDALLNPKTSMTQDSYSEPNGFRLLTGLEHHPEKSASWRYLRQRDVPIGLIRSCFGYVPGSMRVWMLIDDNWWQGRSLTKMEPKYISPPWPKGDSLWNGRALETHDNIVLCEGVFSAIAVGNGAIALCGKTMNEQQAARISRSTSDDTEITIMLDADAIDNAYDMANALRLSGFNGDINIQYMDSGDPADGVIGNIVRWDWSAEIKHALAL